MNTFKPLVIIIVALVLVLGALYFYKSKGLEQAPGSGQKEESMGKRAEGFSGELLAGQQSPLLDFVKADYDKAIVSDKLVILYFYANWCPICRAEFPIMKEVFDSLPTDKAIAFRVNFNDNQTDKDEENLAREFGIAYQHTKVFLKGGQRILKSPETWSKDHYIQEVNNYLK